MSEQHYEYKCPECKGVNVISTCMGYFDDIDRNASKCEDCNWKGIAEDTKVPCDPPPKQYFCNACTQCETCEYKTEHPYQAGVGKAEIGHVFYCSVDCEQCKVCKLRAPLPAIQHIKLDVTI
jgi:phage FluMu protein Com